MEVPTKNPSWELPSACSTRSSNPLETLSLHRESPAGQNAGNLSGSRLENGSPSAAPPFFARTISSRIADVVQKDGSMLRDEGGFNGSPRVTARPQTTELQWTLHLGIQCVCQVGDHPPLPYSQRTAEPQLQLLSLPAPFVCTPFCATSNGGTCYVLVFYRIMIHHDCK